MKLIRSILTAAGLLSCSLAIAADSPPVEVHVNLANPNIPANKKHTNYLKVGIKGLDQKEKLARPPVNVAIVLDRSGSMEGDKIANAKRAAIEALSRLGGDDIVSIVAFDSTADTVVPATKMGNRSDIVAKIEQIRAGGGTALFAGVSRAAEELRKFKNPRQVNRIILLSDGQANVGPSSVEDLARLGISYAKESICVTTVGLGLDYNERLMARLAQTSDGNHAFVQDPQELAALFKEELGDVLSVVAQDIRIRIQCPESVRPVRVLGRDADIRGGTVEVSMNQLRAGQEKYALLEVETPNGSADSDQLVGEVSVSYRLNTEDKPSTIDSRAVAHRVSKEAEVASSENQSILIEVAKLIGIEKQILAVKLNDEGKPKEAEKLFLENRMKLEEQSVKYKSRSLKELGDANANLNEGKDAGGAKWEMFKRQGQTSVNAAITQNESKNALSNTAELSAAKSTEPKSDKKLKTK